MPTLNNSTRRPTVSRRYRPHKYADGRRYACAPSIEAATLAGVGMRSISSRMARARLALDASERIARNPSANSSGVATSGVSIRATPAAVHASEFSYWSVLPRAGVFAHGQALVVADKFKPSLACSCKRAWKTAVNVQAMVFGNRDDRSGTGVGFTRDRATKTKGAYGQGNPGTASSCRTWPAARRTNAGSLARQLVQRSRFKGT